MVSCQESASSKRVTIRQRQLGQAILFDPANSQNSIESRRMCHSSAVGVLKKLCLIGVYRGFHAPTGTGLGNPPPRLEPSLRTG